MSKLFKTFERKAKDESIKLQRISEAGIALDLSCGSCVSASRETFELIKLHLHSVDVSLPPEIL